MTYWQLVFSYKYNYAFSFSIYGDISIGVLYSSHCHALSFIFVFPFLHFLFFFSSFSSFSSYPPIFFFLFPLSERKLPLTILFIFHVSPFPWSMCHMDTCSRWHSPHHMVLMPCVLLPWCHVATLGHAMWKPLVMPCGTTPCVTRHHVP